MSAGIDCPSHEMNPDSVDSFLPVYEQQFAPRLGMRANGFRRIFQHLNNSPRRIR
jgi:hypothetical protein